MPCAIKWHIKAKNGMTLFTFTVAKLESERILPNRKLLPLRSHIFWHNPFFLSLTATAKHK